MILGGDGGSFYATEYNDMWSWEPCSVSCPSGYIPSSESSVFTQCPVGSSQSGSSCTVCPSGQYQDVAGQTGCKWCPSGTWTAGLASASDISDCILCPAVLTGVNCTICACKNGGQCVAGTAGSSDISCSCLTGWSGVDCSLIVLSPTTPPVAFIPGGSAASASGTKSTTSSAASTSAGSGQPAAMQLISTMQMMTRIACSNVQVPLWYLSFIQGVGGMQLLFRSDAIISLASAFGYTTDIVDQSASPAADTNLAIYYKQAINTFDSVLDVFLLNYIFILSFVAGLQLPLQSMTIALCKKWLLASSDQDGLTLKEKFNVVYGNLYVCFFSATVYPLFVAVFVHYAVWLNHSLVGFFVGVIGLFLLWLYLYLTFAIFPSLARHFRDGPAATWQFHRKWNCVFKGFVDGRWSFLSQSVALQLIDAIIVVAGCFGQWYASSQLFLMWLTSLYRSFIVIKKPIFEKRRAQRVAAITYISDSVVTFLMLCVSDRSRTDTSMQNVTILMAVVQLLVVVANIVNGLADPVVAAALFLVQTMRNRRRRVHDAEMAPVVIAVDIHHTESPAGQAASYPGENPLRSLRSSLLPIATLQSPVCTSRVQTASLRQVEKDIRLFVISAIHSGPTQLRSILLDDLEKCRTTGGVRERLDNLDRLLVTVEPFLFGDRFLQWQVLQSELLQLQNQQNPLVSGYQ